MALIISALLALSSICASDAFAQGRARHRSELQVAAFDFTADESVSFIRQTTDCTVEGDFSEIVFSLDENYEVGRPALHQAIIDEDIRAIKFWIRRGANVNEQDCLGNTPLLLAVQSEQFEVALLLVQNGAHLEIGGLSGKAALFYASLKSEFANAMRRRSSDIIRNDEF